MIGAVVLKVELGVHLEIINKCRKEVGEDFPISVKLNSADFQKGGFTPDESIQVAQMLENAGVDIIEISGVLMSNQN